MPAHFSTFSLVVSLKRQTLRLKIIRSGETSKTCEMNPMKMGRRPMSEIKRIFIGNSKRKYVASKRRAIAAFLLTFEKGFGLGP